MKIFTLKFCILLTLVFTANFDCLFSQGLYIGHDQAHLEDLKYIPREWIDSAKTRLQIVYWHTSHGSHITTGMSRLDAFMGGNGIYTRAEEKLPGVLYLVDYFGDLSAGEDTWPQITRDYLDDPANQDVNVVMWSWCQILGHDGDENPGYCSKMDSLIAEYGKGGTKITSGERNVPVDFVYMTGHVNGQGEEGRTNQINNYIRNHCMTNNRILFDFADIESWDPDDNYFLDDSVNDACSYMVNGERTGNWAEEWIDGKVQMNGEDDTLHNEPNGGDWYQCTAEHSHPVNANMKAYAAWYLFSRLAGWKIQVTSIDVWAENDDTTITANQGTLQMEAEIFPAGADDRSITWSVNNGTGEASISQTGMLHAVSNGTVQVVATANDGSGIKDSIQVTISNQIIPVSSILISGERGLTTIQVNKGKLQLYATISPANASDDTIHWSVINETGKASISQTGLLQADCNGTVVVVATANDGSGVTDSLRVKISHQFVLVSSLDLTCESGSASIDQPGGFLQIKAIVLPPEATDKTISWSVINLTGQAFISSKGLLQATSNGVVVVVATAIGSTGVRDSLRVNISGQTTGLYDFVDPDLIIITDMDQKLLNIHWKVPALDKCMIRIYNILGQIAYTSEVVASDQQVDLSHLETGYYILHISRTKKAFAPYKFLVK